MFNDPLSDETTDEVEILKFSPAAMSMTSSFRAVNNSALKSGAPDLRFGFKEDKVISNE